ncbi:unnamed protein product [Ixodes pacificus]
MEARVFINVDVEPFCTELVFPVGVPANGYVRIIFGNFSKTCLKNNNANEEANSLDANNVATAVSDKVLVRSPSVDGEPVCTLRTATLPGDLKDDPQDSEQPIDENGAPKEIIPEEPPVSPSKALSAYELSSKDRRKQKNPVKIRLEKLPAKRSIGDSVPPGTRRSGRKRKPVSVRYTDSSGDEAADGLDADGNWSGSDSSVKSLRPVKQLRAKKVSSSENTTSQTLKVAALKIRALKQRSKERKAVNVSDETIYNCDVCEKTFTSRSKWCKHSWCHRPKGERPYKCNQCTQAFVSKNAMERHQLKHAKAMPYTCEKCCIGFTTSEHLTEHLRGHKDYRCECCSQLYLSRRGLRKHLSQSHKKPSLWKPTPHVPSLEGNATEHDQEAGSVEHKCSKCQVVYEHEEALADHTITAHPEQQVFPCDSCRKVFTDHSLLLAHLRKHMEIKMGTDPRDQTYLCNICDKELKSLSTLRVHVQSHNKVRSFKCDICQEKYTTPGNLRKHKKIHDTTQKYKCPQCPKEFTNNNYMLKHIKRVHTRDFKYGCSYCPKRFQEQKRFQQHMVLMHAGELTPDDYDLMTLVKKLQCGQCSFTTYSTKSFRQHEVTHTGKYPYTCSECSKGFTFRFELAKHVRCIHNAQSFRCNRCKRTFTAEEVYKVHKEHHDRGLGMTCPECGNMYETQGHYEQHMQAHSKELPYECVVCKKRFALTRSLNLHRLSHDKHKTPRFRAYNGNRNWDYYCELCQVYYKYGSSLVAHRVCVHGNGPQTTCPYCDKKFNSRLTLSMHLRTHTRERPMRCSYCGKTFRVWNSLKRHVVTNHTKDFKLFCALCNKGFVSKSYLKVHLKSAHKAVMAGSGKRRRLPQGASAAMATIVRVNAPLKQPIIIPMPSKVKRTAGGFPILSASGVSLTVAAASTSVPKGQVTQLLEQKQQLQQQSPQLPQLPPPQQQLAQVQTSQVQSSPKQPSQGQASQQHASHLQQSQQPQVPQQQRLEVQDLQSQTPGLQLQQLRPHDQQTQQQREFFEMQQIQHLEGETYSLMLL